MATILISFLRAATVVIGLLFMAIALGAWHFYGLVWAVPFSIAGVALLLVQALLKAHASPLPGISRPANMEPTHAQLALAAKMKIPIVTGMSRADVSHLLTKALDRRTPIERARDEARSVDEGRRDAARLDLKQGAGGLVDLEFLLQTGVLAGAASDPALCGPRETPRLVDALAASGWLPPAAATALHAAHATLLDAGLSCTLDRRPRITVPTPEIESACAAITAAAVAQGLPFEPGRATD